VSVPATTFRRAAMTIVMALTALTLAGVGPARGATARDALVVSTAWLAEHLNDPDLVLLHVGEQGEYEMAHLPGARLVVPRDISEPSSESGLRLEMLSAEPLRERLQALGISDDSVVVVYYGKDWIAPATRVIFTLDYAGLSRVVLLDGGMGAWTREGRPVTSLATAARRGALKPLALRSTIVDAEFVRSHRGKAGFAVVDARDPVFYNGTKTGGSPERPHKTGHIPGAVNVPFSAMTGEDLKIRNADELAASFAKAGVKRGDTVIAYCHIGQQATAALFAARLLGHNVLLYDGSFEDWSRRDYAVETGASGITPHEPVDPAATLKRTR
jgi:thiosulfate/3-mercaptopyruvate sulfurtransferase